MNRLCIYQHINCNHAITHAITHAIALLMLLSIIQLTQLLMHLCNWIGTAQAKVQVIIMSDVNDTTIDMTKLQG